MNEPRRNGLRLGLLAGALLLGGMRGVSVPMGKGYGGMHAGSKDLPLMTAPGGKHRDRKKQGGRCRTKLKRTVPMQDHSRLEHWSSAQLARVGLRKVKVSGADGRMMTGLRAIAEGGANSYEIADKLLRLTTAERRAIRLGITPFTLPVVRRELGKEAA